MQTIKRIKSKLISAGILVAALFAFGTVTQAHTSRYVWHGSSSVSVNPSAVNFGNMNVGTTSNPVSVTIHNNGHSGVTISNVSLSLLQVTYSGPALPATIGAGESVQATLRFSPNAAEKYAGTLTFTEGNGTIVSEQISGTGVSTTTPAPTPVPTPTPTPVPTPAPTPAKLTLSSSALAFGSVTENNTASQTVTVSNTGGSNLTITGVSLTGAGFNISGVSSGLILTPAQSSVLTVTFDPTASGSMTGSVSISSSASGATIALSGSGAAAVSHSASLSWSQDISSANGYNVYSGSVSGGPYTKVTSTPITATSYMDSSVQAGQTYYFVVTAISANNTESGYSNEVAALVP
jgi:hypothetical protein